MRTKDMVVGMNVVVSSRPDALIYRVDAIWDTTVKLEHKGKFIVVEAGIVRSAVAE